MDHDYTVLGVDENASDSELRHAYIELLKKYHPDVTRGNDSDEKTKEITTSYNNIMKRRKEKAGIFHNAFEQTESKSKNDIANYIIEHYDEIPKSESNGRFINTTKMFLNEEIEKKDLHFVDGYTQVSLGSHYTPDFGDGIFGPTDEYDYNYIDKNGNCLFDSNIPLFVYYIGRGIFLRQYSDLEWYVLNRNEERFLSNFRGFKIIYNQESFILNIVNELNRKYEMEANGIKYKISKEGIGYPKWIQKEEDFVRGNIKKTVKEFVEQISDFDTYSRNMYIEEQPKLLAKKKFL